MRPLGYALNGEVIEDEAEAVRAIYKGFTRLENPESLRSLARALSGQNEVEGLSARSKHSHTVSRERAEARLAKGLQPRPLAADGPWSPSTVLGILRNPRYAGLSTYTPEMADGSRRRSWKAEILRDDAGEPIPAEWDAIIDIETWWRTQDILDDTERMTKTSGSTKRRYLGSGLYRCGECGVRVTGASRGYRCAGHVMRTGPAIEEFVTELIARKLSQVDAVQLVQSAEKSPRTQTPEIRIAELEAGQLLRGRARWLVPILGTADPANAFREASLSVQREIVDTLLTVTLFPQPRGRKGFDPASVTVEWR